MRLGNGTRRLSCASQELHHVSPHFSTNLKSTHEHQDIVEGRGRCSDTNSDGDGSSRAEAGWDGHIRG